jgi:hypothetical protein
MDMVKDKQPKEDIAQVSNESLKILIDSVQQDVAKLDRKQDVQQKSLDILYQDREILESILAGISELKQLIVSHREHQDTAMKDVKQEVTDTKDTVSENIGTLVDSIDKKKVVVMKDSNTIDYLKKIFRIH